MEDNVIYMICEMETGRILDCKKHALINEISFSSIFPSKEMASNYRKREMGDSQGEYFTIVEGEIVEFHNNQLTVAYEELVTNKKYSSWSW